MIDHFTPPDQRPRGEKPRLRVVTNSELGTRKRCPREHYYAYQCGYRSLEDVESLRFGTFWHLGMEDWWGFHGQPRLEAAIYAATHQCTDPYEVAKLRALLRGYDARWLDETDFGDVAAVEREFRAPVVNPETGAASRTFVLGGKLDILLRRKFMEHKTSSEDIGFGSVYWRVLTMNSQVSTYYAGAKSLGHEVDGCVYDVVKKPTIRPSQVPLVDEDGLKIVRDANGERVRLKPSLKPLNIPVLDEDGLKIVLDTYGVRVRGKGGKWRQTGDASCFYTVQTRPEDEADFAARLEAATAVSPWRQSSDTELGYVLQTRTETPDEYEARLVEDIAADPDKYFQRGEVVRLEAEERDAAQDVWQILRAMREDELAGRHPRNADSCKRFGRLCDFFPVCTGEATLDDTSRYVRLENVHAELSADFEP